MFKHSVITILFITTLGKMASSATSMPLDSVGTEKRNGKNYVVHKVVPKETVFAISRKYHVPVDQLMSANPGIKSGINVGQLVYVPRKTSASVPVVAKTPVAKPVPVVTTPAASRATTVDAQDNKIHRVEARETLFSISRLYKVTPANIKKWNNLTSDVVEIGDNLIVGLGNKPATPMQNIPQADEVVEKAKETPVRNVTASTKPVTRNEEPAPRVEMPTRTEETVRVTPETENIPRTESISKITESGLAELIDNRSDNNKYLALHKSAPVGTILQVKNIMNNQSVYVRVIGKLPETGANDKVVIKVSKRAYQKLAALDNKFRVEVSYMP